MFIRLSILSLLAVSLAVHAQAQLDFGKVKADKRFNCEAKDPVDSLGKICDSKYDFELRLTAAYMPYGDYDMTVVTYDGKNWDATKFCGSLLYFMDTARANRYRKMVRLKAVKTFEEIFDTLKVRHVFTLPNQSKFKVRGYVMDGVSYSLAFKAGNKFRSYSFNNTDFYVNRYPDVAAFRDYDRIAEVLRTWLVEE